VLQQKPSTQNPLVHWSGVVHGAPFGAFPTQTELAQ
jgi:hypothetical protein